MSDISSELLSRLRDAAVTTPGRLGIAMVGLIVLSLLTGVIGLVSLQGKANTLDDLAARREPVSAAAAQIYRSLSDADATAASAFLSGTVEPAQMRQRYQTDIAQAGAALAVAANDTSVAGDIAGALRDLSIRMPVYTGLIEVAMANNLQGFPVGAAYLREAYSLMHSTLLPAAQRLYSVDTQRLAAEQDDATGFPWFTAVFFVGLMVALWRVQRYLRQRTNRLFNVGLVIATSAVALALLWIAVALVVETIYVNSGESAGSAQVALLSQARTKALQARTDETLTLVARGGQNYDADFAELAKDLGGQDGSAGLLGASRANARGVQMEHLTDAAIEDAKSWFALHDQVTKTNQGGDYDQAVTLALGTGSAGEAATFYRLDDTLDAAIQQARRDFIEQTSIAGGWLTALPIGVLVLCVAAAAGATAGLWQRIREYR